MTPCIDCGELFERKRSPRCPACRDARVKQQQRENRRRRGSKPFPVVAVCQYCGKEMPDRHPAAKTCYACAAKLTQKRMQLATPTDKRAVYIYTDEWLAQRRVPCRMVGETRRRYRIILDESVKLLPTRKILPAGEKILVEKDSVQIEEDGDTDGQ